MATKDLGSIQVQEDVRVPDESQIDVLGPLVEAGQRVVQDVKDGIISDSTEDFQDVTKNEIAAASAPVEPEPFESTGSPEADSLLSHIRTLEAQVNQTTGSTRARVELAIRQKAEEVRRRFPGLADELAGEITRFERFDPNFEFLNTIDVQNAAFNKQAAAKLEDIRDFAYKPVSSGGLGLIPGRHRFGTPEFAKYHAHMSALLEERNLNTQAMLALQAADQMDAYSNLETWDSWMLGEAAGVRELTDGVRELANDYALALTDPTSENGAEKIALWNNGGREQALNSVQDAILDIEVNFQRQFPSRQAKTEAYSAAKLQKDAMVTALSTLAQGVATNDTTLIQAYQAWDTMQTIRLERANPESYQMVRTLEPFVPLMEALKGGFAGEGKLALNEIATYVADDVASYMGRTFGMASIGGLPANASPEDILAHTRAIADTNPNRYGSGQLTPRGNMTGAVRDTTLSADPNLMRLVKEGNESISPDYAASHFIATTARLDDLARYGNQTDPAALRAALVAVGADGVLELAEKGKVSSQPSSVLAMADMAETVALRYEPVRRAANQNLWNGEIVPGLPAEQVLDVDVSALDKGVVRFTVNEERLNRLAKGRSPTFTGALGIGGVDPDRTARARARSEAIVIARDLTTKINEEIAYKARLEALQNGQDKPDYVAQWTSGGFADDFGIDLVDE